MMEEFVINQLKRWDTLYERGVPEVSDERYDTWFYWAKGRYPNNTYFKSLRQSGASGKDVKLPYVLGSLDKVKPDTLQKWLDKHPDEMIVITQKLDGVSIFVRYENGEVVFAATRGKNGTVGKDITEKARIFCPKISDLNTIEFRGEAMLTGDDHRNIGFKTRRNGVAGILNRDDTKNCEFIKPFFYELISDSNDDGVSYSSESEKFLYIANYFYYYDVGLPEWNRENSNKITPEYLIGLIGEWNTASYDTDGLVLTIDNSMRENVRLPKNKIAFKVNDESVKTKVTSIDWNVGRTGKVTPVVNIEPIEIKGVTVSKATGFNARFIMDNFVSTGCGVDIVRSGDVIPYIVGVDSVTKSVIDSIPVDCPNCGELLEYNDVDLFCINEDCQPYKKLAHFFRTLGAENLTTKTFEHLGITTIEDAYDIDELEIAEHPGFGLKSGSNIEYEIQSTLKTTPERLLAAFGVKGIGIDVSKLIIEKYDIEHVIYRITQDELVKIKGIGSILAENVIREKERIKKIYEMLKDLGLSFINNDDTLNGKVFVLTGGYTIKRPVLKNMIEERGGSLKTAVSKKTDYVVCADTSSNSGKMKKARELGISIISYDELMEMLEG